MSTADWPGRLAAVVFVQGCPWRCHYCHNADLQPYDRAGQPAEVPVPASSGASWPRLLGRLRRRVGLLDGVVFSGGEPTLDPYLPQAMADVRALGFEVGLHTAGLSPRRLTPLLPQLRWVGFDVKTDPTDYGRVTGVRRSGRHAWTSLEQVLAAGVPTEVRTTYHPSLVLDASLLSVARRLRAVGVSRWVIQTFRSTLAEHAVLVAQARPLSGELLQRLQDCGPFIELR